MGLNNIYVHIDRSESECANQENTFDKGKIEKNSSIISQSDGGKYEGEFKDGKRHGQGTGTYLNGEKYVGEFKEGKRHGQGTYTYSDGSKYEGEFKDGEIHGQGILISLNGKKYFGECWGMGWLRNTKFTEK
jgi:hypothetical protein